MSVIEESVEMTAQAFHAHVYKMARAQYDWENMAPSYRAQIREVVRFTLAYGEAAGGGHPVHVDVCPDCGTASSGHGLDPPGICPHEYERRVPVLYVATAAEVVT